jgi:hypothetical protein
VNIFVSHSWLDKDVTQQIADALAGSAEVWLDVRKLTPGAGIQHTIDAAIAQQDIVVLIWSQHAAGSKNVAAEISSAKRLGISIIPCLLDDTPLDRNEDVAGLLGIALEPHGPQLGIFRL